ncbi:MAG TPA: 7-carboxy-7-deazaguanine synthase QueE [Methylomirabilota bacterium]|jgi:7-carboxy-7-deazaguanine synthase
MALTTPRGRIAETFYSIQGEGATAGLPAVFVRLQGCTVGCGWCDTKYSWDPAGGREVELPTLLDEVAAFPCRRVVITGGEPLESPLFVPLAAALAARGYLVEVETSGTRVPAAGADAGIQWNVSVKLSGSGVPEATRIIPAAIRDLLARKAWWKFVVGEPGEVGEVLRLAERFALPRERVLLQPEGLRAEDLAARTPWLVEACKTHGFRFSPRLHILLWGARRGV